MPTRLTGLLLAALLLLASTLPVSAITGGRPDGEAHPNVGVVLLPGVGFCSGALIGPQTFLTAGHCTELFDAVGAEQVFLSFDSQVDLSAGLGGLLTASDWATHPAYDAADWPFTIDVGVIWLDSPVMGVTPADLPEAGRLETLVPDVGTSLQRYTTVGYGQAGTVRGRGTPRPLVTFERKVASNRAKTGQGSGGAFGLTPLHLALAVQPSPSSGGACQGDSGAPVFVGDSKELVALHVGSPRLGPGGVICARISSLNGRLDLPIVLDWLESVTV
jgi:hypothetical protein